MFTNYAVIHNCKHYGNRRSTEELQNVNIAQFRRTTEFGKALHVLCIQHLLRRIAVYDLMNPIVLAHHAEETHHVINLLVGSRFVTCHLPIYDCRFNSIRINGKTKGGISFLAGMQGQFTFAYCRWNDE